MTSKLYKDFDADLDLDEQTQDYDGLRLRQPCSIAGGKRTGNRNSLRPQQMIIQPRARSPRSCVINLVSFFVGRQAGGNLALQYCCISCGESSRFVFFMCGDL